MPEALAELMSDGHHMAGHGVDVQSAPGSSQRGQHVLAENCWCGVRSVVILKLSVLAREPLRADILELGAEGSRVRHGPVRPPLERSRQDALSPPFAPRKQHL